MIIKSMSRKEATFGQLLGYMNREAASERYSLRHNCYARKEGELEAEFTANSERLRARKNGVFLYHEILSITKAGDLSDEERKDALRQIAQKYIEMRCPESLVYGVVHDDHSHHLHYHLMISANAVGSAERLRLSKADFQALKVQMERRVLADYPEIRQKVAIDRSNQGERLSQRGEAMKRRTGEVPERKRVKETIAEIFADSLDREELFSRLRSAKLDLYVRGKNIGIIDGESGRKYRLNRLGLQERFDVLSARMTELSRIERESVSDRAQMVPGEERTTEMSVPGQKIVEASQGLQEGATSLVEKGKKAFEGVIDQLTPTNEAAKRETVDAKEAAYQARMREMEGIRSAQKPEQAQQKSTKK